MHLNCAWIISLLIMGSLATNAFAQVDREDPDFVKQSPTIGDRFPELTVYTTDGKEFHSSQFRGNYTVISFGCLTCPPFMRKVAGMEAVYRDYGPKNVRFYFTYKALAHPERNGLVQPATQEERLQQAREATKRLGNTIPFLVDAIDNRMKHALLDRQNVPLTEPATYDNAEFIVDPQGTIVRKRTWSNPEQVRKDLEVLVGKVDKITRPEDVLLNVEKTTPDFPSKSSNERVSRAGMLPLVAVPRIDVGGPPFYAKLRAEADESVIERGEGKLYLGFHLDPFLGAHWNNLKCPLRFDLESPTGVKFSVEGGEASQYIAKLEPIEFILNVSAWPIERPVRLTVTYSTCTNDICHEIYQVYELQRAFDRDGGRAVGSLEQYTPDNPLRRAGPISPVKSNLLFLAIVFWPCWIPFAAAILETSSLRRRWLYALGAIGIVLGLACYVPAVLHPEEWLVAGMDGQYDLSAGSTLQVSICMIWQGLFLVMNCALLFGSSQSRLRRFGILVVMAAAIAYLGFYSGL